MASRTSAMAISVNVTVQREFSNTLPRKFVEITAYHEQASASAINGTISRAIFFAVSECAIRPNSYRTMAHWMAKQSSAAVAIERPTKMLESQVLKRQILCTSARGRMERNAQPKT